MPAVSWDTVRLFPATTVWVGGHGISALAGLFPGILLAG